MGIEKLEPGVSTPTGPFMLRPSTWIGPRRNGSALDSRIGTSWGLVTIKRGARRSDPPPLRYCTQAV